MNSEDVNKLTREMDEYQCTLPTDSPLRSMLLRAMAGLDEHAATVAREADLKAEVTKAKRVLAELGVSARHDMAYRAALEALAILDGPPEKEPEYPYPPHIINGKKPNSTDGPNTYWCGSCAKVVEEPDLYCPDCDNEVDCYTAGYDETDKPEPKCDGKGKIPTRSHSAGAADSKVDCLGCPDCGDTA